MIAHPEHTDGHRMTGSSELEDAHTDAATLLVSCWPGSVDCVGHCVGTKGAGKG